MIIIILISHTLFISFIMISFHTNFKTFQNPSYPLLAFIISTLHFHHFWGPNIILSFSTHFSLHIYILNSYICHDIIISYVISSYIFSYHISYHHFIYHISYHHIIISSFYISSHTHFVIIYIYHHFIYHTIIPSCHPFTHIFLSYYYHFAHHLIYGVRLIPFK